MQRPRLRDNTKNKPFELYPLGAIPEAVIYEIGRWIVYYYVVGKSDLSGEDWGDIFSKAIGGNHLNSPVGLADVTYEGMAWSVKSVKANTPHESTSARVISGRCSPDFSYGIENPHDDIEKTGRAVLGIWNERINIAKDNYEPLRSCLLIRNPNTLAFTLYEHELHRFNTSEFSWRLNKNGNLQGYDASDAHRFTWQPHGSQFTIIYPIPPSAVKFSIKRPPVLNFENTLKEIGYDPSWVTIL